MVVKNVGKGKEAVVEDKTMEIVKDFYPFGYPNLDFFLPDGNIFEFFC